MVLFVVLSLCLFITTNALIIRKDFTQICGQNLTLDQPSESLRINFDVIPDQSINDVELSNCTSFITWSGDSNFKLLPFTARTDPSVPDDENPKVVLSITDFLGKIIKLEMFGPKSFYLSITPVQRKPLLVSLSIGCNHYCPPESTGNSTHRYCPEYYRTCDWHHCIYNLFLCDQVVQCAGDEILCYERPTDAFLLLSFLGIMFSFALVSFLLAVYIYFKFYRDRVYLLTDFKPKSYGAVNGSFDSSNSFASLIGTDLNNKKSHFYNNIQHHYTDKVAFNYK